MVQTTAAEQEISLNDCLSSVEHFHAQVDSPIARSPRTLPCDSLSAAGFAERLMMISAELAAVAGEDNLLLRRASFAVEELAEWLHAHAKNDLHAAADALGDRFYVLLGDAVASGMPLGAIFNEVHRSNMTKTQHLSNNKGGKGSTYVPPDIQKVLHEHNLSQTCQAAFGSDASV